MVDLGLISKEIEFFHCEKENELYLNWSGLKDKMNLSSVYEKYRHLFGFSSFPDVEEEGLHGRASCMFLLYSRSASLRLSSSAPPLPESIFKGLKVFQPSRHAFSQDS